MSSASFCLDSDVLIWHLRKGHREDVSQYLKELAAQGDLVTTAISIAEIEQGARPGELDETRALLRSLPIIAIDRDVAERAGEIARELRALGVTLNLADALIAAACLVHRLALVTLNVRHFEKVVGLELNVVP